MWSLAFPIALTEIDAQVVSSMKFAKAAVTGLVI